MKTSKPLRENVRRVSRLTDSKWSRWHPALKPGTSINSPRYKRRKKGHYGVIVRTILTRFKKSPYDDGIYELRVSKGKKKQVVYVGAAHRDGPGSLSKRIREYCNGGSHLERLIDRALKLGYRISVRVQNISKSRSFVYKCEDKYLAKYEYAWNKRKNGIRRDIPPE
ncbi:uncharacterized protein LOC116300272 [Actinia tenebrosa]|uniref:Uncharacterized protein LOC116300272 n=1 Tax=Actinia tenebrosa TaxID=6105 RepID=A0A6P8I8S6_ACTTE|nr:uncharacterized protein LOC116300272 [Actinia tenebrosa]XP_031564969.1 uncharacterized protein LOC116300272 [Actinia tenebrosa]